MSVKNNRSDDLLNIRPAIPEAKVNEHTSPEERFQNLTLRPIIKLQHSLLIEIFKQHIARTKTKFSELSDHQRVSFIEQTFNMTVEEYQVYAQNTNAFNKRITHMLAQRIKDSIIELL